MSSQNEANDDNQYNLLAEPGAEVTSSKIHDAGNTGVTRNTFAFRSKVHSALSFHEYIVTP